MSVQTSLVVSSVTTSDPVPVDWRADDFKVSIAVILSGGAVLTYTVQHTLDDPKDFTSSSDYNTNADWLDHDDLNAKTSTDDGAYSFPVRATRLNVTAFTSGTATFKVLQA